MILNAYKCILAFRSLIKYQSFSLPRVTSAEATAIPVHPFGAYGLPPVGNRTIKERTAPRLPLHGSKAIGLGRER